jgi:hypothetical protein
LPQPLGILTVGQIDKKIDGQTDEQPDIRQTLRQLAKWTNRQMDIQMN